MYARIPPTFWLDYTMLQRDGMSQYVNIDTRGASLCSLCSKKALAT